MKTVFSVVLFLSSVSIIHCQSTDEIIGKVMDIVPACIAEVGLSDDEQSNLWSMTVEDRALQCMYACGAKKLNVMSDGNTLVTDTALAILEIFRNDVGEDLYNTLNEKINQCSSISDGDQCDAAYDIYTCVAGN